MSAEWYSCPCCQGNGGWSHSQPPNHESEIMSLRESLLDLGLRYEEQYDALAVLINAVKVKGVEEWVREEVRVAEYVLKHPLANTRRSRFWKVPIPDD